MSKVWIDDRAHWKRPFTNKRYLHPPFSEEVITMWPDGKIMFEEVNPKITPFHYTASAFKILRGENFSEIDFKKISYETDPEGIPVHAFVSPGNVSMRMEAFCSIGRSPVAYTKLRFENHSGKAVDEMFSLIVRSGNMKCLMGMDEDCYAHMNTNLGNWGFVPCGFSPTEKGAMDENNELRLEGLDGCAVEWIGNEKGIPWRYRGMLCVRFTLPAGGAKEFYVAFCRKASAPGIGAYEEEKKKAAAFWLGELEKISVFPKKENKKYYTMYRTLVANSLQMFACPKGENYVIPRQGCTQNNIWPAEAVYLLRALDRIGDFRIYTEKAIDFYFERLYVTEGEEKGSFMTMDRSIGWASDTAAVLESVAYHMYYGTRADYQKYGARAFEIYSWIEKKRAQTKNGDYAGKGLFPPMRSCDWDDVYQTWTKTDVFNLQAYRALICAFTKYEDPQTASVVAGYRDYLRCMQDVLEEVARRYSDGDELIVPMHLGLEVSEPQQGGPFIHDGVSLIYNDVCPPGSEYAGQIEQYYKNRCMFQKGLHGLMNCGLLPYQQWDPWAGHVWYTGFVEQEWFNVFLREGRRKEAKQTLDAQLRYSMTSEFYVCERYCDNDPYFVPWLPNASGNGRIIEMLCDYYIG